MARKYNWRSFAEARKFAQSLKSKNSTDWNKYCKSGKRPDDIPSNPHKIYKDEWTTWKYFIGNEFLSFKEARKFVHSLNLEGTNNQKVWNKYCKSGEKPDNIPTTPDRHYKKEWKGSEDWLKKPRFEIPSTLDCHTIKQENMFTHLKFQVSEIGKSFAQLANYQKTSLFYPRALTTIMSGKVGLIG